MQFLFEDFHSIVAISSLLFSVSVRQFNRCVYFQELVGVDILKVSFPLDSILYILKEFLSNLFERATGLALRN